MRKPYLLLVLLSGLWGIDKFDDIHVESHDSNTPIGDKHIHSTQDLAKKAKGETLGDYLENEALVESASYGSSVGRPVVKGMEGYRVGITQGNVASNDLSAMSQDHAVGTMPKTTQQIELISGPTSLLFGSYSGGVIRVKQDEHNAHLHTGMHFDSDIAYGTNQNDITASGTIGMGNEEYSLYNTLYYHQNDDYATGGGDKVVDSYAKTFEGHMVAGYKVDTHNVLKLYGDYLYNSYGIPNTTTGTTSILMHSYRYGLIWHVEDVGVFDHIESEIQDNRYLHYERESARNDGLFGQDQLTLSTLMGMELNDWHMDIHINYAQSALQVCHEHGKCSSFTDAARTSAEDGSELKKHYDLSGIAYAHSHPMPDTTQNNLTSALNLKHFFGDHEVTLGARLHYRYMDVNNSNIVEEWLMHTAIDSDYYRDEHKLETSFSLGAYSIISEDITMQNSLSYIERLPSDQEYFWNGFHHATDSYILGNRDLNKEQSLNVDSELLVVYGDFSTRVAGFYYHFFNYLYQNPLADSNGTLIKDVFHATPVWQMQEKEASIFGGSITQYYTLDLESQTLKISLGVDALRGVFHTGGNIPRMAPFSAKLGLEHIVGNVESRVSYKQVDKSRFLADNESFTPGYGWLDASISYTIKSNHSTLNLYLKGLNLTDSKAYNHLSFLKNYAPLIGRQIQIGLSGSY